MFGSAPAPVTAEIMSEAVEAIMVGRTLTLDALVARFRDHTDAIFKRHGMISIAYWLPTDEPLKGRTLIYILKHPSRQAATANWKAFHDDPEWIKVSTASEANGKLVEKVDSTYMKLTDWSPAI